MDVVAQVKKQLGIVQGDKNSPAYECTDYTNQSSTWTRLKGIECASWLQFGDNGKVQSTLDAQVYLQRFKGEDDSSYEQRLNLSVYEYKFQEALQELTALVFSAGVEKIDLPWAFYHSDEDTEASGIIPYWDDIDGKGMSGDMFLYQIVYDGMRDGHTFVYVDYTDAPPGLTLAEYNAIVRRPYWLQIDPRDVINWRVEQINSEQVLTRVTVREKSYEADGDYGEKEVTQYRVYRLVFDEDLVYVTWQLYRLDSEMPQVGGIAVVDEGRLDFPEIPLYPVYIGKPERWGCSKPPLMAIAELNLELYRDRSDYNYTHHLCNVTMLELISDVGAPPPEQLIVAPGKIIPSGYRARWVSPDGQSLNLTRQKIKDCEDAIAFLRADYLKKPLPDQTAFATSVQLAAVDSKLEISAQFLCESLNPVLRSTAIYMGQATGGRLLVNPEVRKVQAPNAEMANFYKNLQIDGMISVQTLRNIYKDMGTFPEWYSADLEQQQLAIEAEQQTATQAVAISLNPDLFKAVSDAALKDMIDKRTAIEILAYAGQLPPGVTVDDVLKRAGEDIALQAIGTFGVAPSDPNAPPGGVALDPNRILTAYTALEKMGSPVAEELKKSLNQYLVQSANEIGRRKGTPKSDKPPEDRET